MFAQRANEAEPEMSRLFHLISNSFCIERSECIICYTTAVKFISASLVSRGLACRFVENSQEHSGKSTWKLHAGEHYRLHLFSPENVL